MEIRVLDIEKMDMQFITYDNQTDNAIVSVIAGNTAQTWQEGRTAQETARDTGLGKLSEDIFQEFVRQSFPGVNILSYDEIRNDGYTKHAPFDFLVWPDDSAADIDRVVNCIREDIGNSQGPVKISDRTRQLCQGEGIKIVEIKSTRITSRLKPSAFNGNADYSDPRWTKQIAEKILGDDFLTYPNMCRKTSSYSFAMSDYIRLLSGKGIAVRNDDAVRRFETQRQLWDISVRIYVDEPANAAFIVGWIDKNSFYQSAALKRMPQPGKSERALYFAVPLTRRKSFGSFEQFVEN